VQVVLSEAAFRLESAISYAPGIKCDALVLDPKRSSLGAFNTSTGEMWISVYLTTADGDLPVPMPLLLVGTFQDGRLQLSATADLIDAGVEFRLDGGLAEGDWTGHDESAIPSDGEWPCEPVIETDGG
jgi:hypothetical protein